MRMAMFNKAVSAYTAYATKFNSGTDIYRSFPGLVGVSDSTKTGVMSGFFKIPVGSAGTFNKFLQDNAADNAGIFWPTGNGFRLQWTDSGAAVCIKLYSTGVSFADGNWHHVILAWDTSDATKCKVYVDDVDATDTVTLLASIVNTNIQYTDNAYYFGYGNTGFSVCEFYLACSSWLDITNTATRRKFVTAALKPAGDLLTTSGVPTPTIYFNQPYTSFLTNPGTGGNFSLDAGTLVGDTPP